MGICAVQPWRTVVSATFVALLLVGGNICQPSAQSGSAASHTRVVATQVSARSPSMWVWNWGSAAHMCAFAKHRGVSDVYMYVHPAQAVEVPGRKRLTDTLAACGRRKVRVWAMGGDPSWIVTPRAGISWLREVSTLRGLSGIHLELEPNQLPGYAQQPRHYSDLSAALIGEINIRTRLPVDASVAWWAGQVGTRNGTSTYLTDAVRAADRVTLITYSTTATQIWWQSRDGVAAAQTQHKPFRLASETNPVGPPWLSFALSSHTVMLAEQSKVAARLAHIRGFCGFAIHDYRGWARLPVG